ncbi:hypothetical protein JYU34_000539 [Plutella xylostella]|uniref:Uncharacterized protein n=1 Tax=Plutella xylostella TaxID=51655 RepID=A0ABQ7R7Z8_PLUXY|nr:hypothetical protein JYU34_000539 [Plutella xylostella]
MTPAVTNVTCEVTNVTGPLVQTPPVRATKLLVERQRRLPVRQGVVGSKVTESQDSGQS